MKGVKLKPPPRARDGREQSRPSSSLNFSPLLLSFLLLPLVLHVGPLLDESGGLEVEGRGRTTATQPRVPLAPK